MVVKCKVGKQSKVGKKKTTREWWREVAEGSKQRLIRRYVEGDMTHTHTAPSKIC
jgi:hypothetical protein